MRQSPRASISSIVRRETPLRRESSGTDSPFSKRG
nr:MAG TPA: hypothetical protein [Caudoviricetes sp.]